MVFGILYRNYLFLRIPFADAAKNKKNILIALFQLEVSTIFRISSL